MVGKDNKKTTNKKAMVERHVKTTMWYEVCYAEEHMTNPNGVARKHSRQVFKDLRKMFDREVQRLK